MKYQTIVGNIGTVYDGNSKREAMRHANESRIAWGDAGVIVMGNGEPIAETETLQIEVTDTFAGEANYAWVRRRLFNVWQGASQRTIARDAKRAADLHGRWDWEGNDTLRARGDCLIAFITSAAE